MKTYYLCFLFCFITLEQSNAEPTTYRDSNARAADLYKDTTSTLSGILDSDVEITEIDERYKEKAEYLIESPDSKSFLLSPEKVSANFLNLHSLFLVLKIGIIFFIFFILLLPIIVFANRYLIIRRVKKKRMFRNKLMSLVFQQLNQEIYSNLHVFAACKNNLQKYVLWDIFIDLLSYLKGEEAKKIETLFYRGKMDVYALKKIRNSRGANKAVILKMFTYINPNLPLVRQIKKSIYSKNKEIRLFASQAYFLQYPEKILAYFEAYSYSLSLWEQISYYEFFVLHSIRLPYFHSLAHSKNYDVAKFAIRMVRLFNQKKGNIDGYEDLLTHPNIEVRIEFFKTLAELEYPNLGDMFIGFFPHVSKQIRIQIITYLAKLPETTSESLMSFFEQADDDDVRQYILESIVNFVKGGKKQIIKFSKQNKDTHLRDLSKHVLLQNV